MALPPETRLFMCHDYKAPRRDCYAWETMVAEQRAHAVNGSVAEDLLADAPVDVLSVKAA